MGMRVTVTQQPEDYPVTMKILTTTAVFAAPWLLRRCSEE